MFGETTVPPVNTVSYCDPFTTSLDQCVFDRFTDGGDCESTQSAIGIVCQSKYSTVQHSIINIISFI